MFTVVTIFAIAMGFFESAIVIYLRELLNVIFDQKQLKADVFLMKPHVITTEILREAATVIMLITVGYIAGKTALSRFAYFIHAFAIWDIFYYVFLKAILNWPETVFGWDLLFLIPMPWVGPVLAPCIVAATMSLLAIIILKYQKNGKHFSFNYQEYIPMLIGIIIILITFMLDYYTYFTSQSSSNIFAMNTNSEVLRLVMDYRPRAYRWDIFALGEGLFLFGIGIYWWRSCEF
jgi:hypothetical protein